MKAYVVLKPGVHRDALAPDRTLGEEKKSLASIKLPRYLEYMRCGRALRCRSGGRPS